MSLRSLALVLDGEMRGDSETRAVDAEEKMMCGRVGDARRFTSPAGLRLAQVIIALLVNYLSQGPRAFTAYVFGYVCVSCVCMGETEGEVKLRLWMHRCV